MLALAVPMIISNLSVPLVGAVDTAVVGHLPEAYHIGAVALGALLFSFLYWGFGFLKMGITGYVARDYGAGDLAGIDRTLLRFLAIGLAFGVLVVAVQSPVIRLALHLLESTERVESLAATYARIRIWSAPATLFVYVLTGLFVGLHNTRLALVLQLVLNLTNVLLDLLFVPVLGYGVAGVAWATLIAEYTAAGVGLYLIRDRLKGALAVADWRLVFDRTVLRAVMATNTNIFIRTICLVFAFAWFTGRSAHYGEVILAANAVLMHFNNFAAHALDGFAHAVEALGGSAYGARSRERFLRAVRLTTAWSAGAALAASLVYLGAGNAIIRLFTTDAEVIDAAVTYLPWMIVAPVLSCWSYQLDGLFIGTGHAREMRNAMLVSTAGYLVLAWWLADALGNHGLFLALSLFMLLRTATLGYYYPGIVRAAEG